MTLLSEEDLDNRIRLYTDLKDALAELEVVKNLLPEVCPSDFSVFSEVLDIEAVQRIGFVIKRAWPALRKTVLADAQKKVDDAEALVRKFETGETIDTPKEAPPMSSCAGDPN